MQVPINVPQLGHLQFKGSLSEVERGTNVALSDRGYFGLTTSALEGRLRSNAVCGSADLPLLCAISWFEFILQKQQRDDEYLAKATRFKHCQRIDMHPYPFTANSRL